MRLAFLCLGAMGAPMAGHLARAGHALTVWNRSPERARRWAASHAGRVAATPAEAARGAEVVFSCTGDDAALRAIALGPDGALAALAGGSVFVDHTSVSASLTRELAAAASKRGIAFLDAPVSGGEEGAQRGQLTIMVGGEPHAFQGVRPLLETYAKSAVHVGPSGAGQLAKMVNQITIAGLIEGLAEALHFARRVGLDPHRVVPVLSKGAAQSWQMDHRAPTMIEGRFDFGFAVDWMRKDLANALAEAERAGLRLPVTELVDRLYAALQARGRGRWDTSSLITLLEDPSP